MAKKPRGVVMTTRDVVMTTRGVTSSSGRQGSLTPRHWNTRSSVGDSWNSRSCTETSIVRKIGSAGKSKCRATSFIWLDSGDDIAKDTRQSADYRSKRWLKNPQLSRNADKQTYRHADKPTTMARFLASKREIVLTQYSLMVKREEIVKMENTALTAESTLWDAAHFLREDLAVFERFVKEYLEKNCTRKKIDFRDLTKSNAAKTAEIKVLHAQIASLKQAMEQSQATLSQHQTFKTFLHNTMGNTTKNKDLSQPGDVRFSAAVSFEETGSDRESEESGEGIDYADPCQLVEILKRLEENNLSLLQTNQDKQQKLDELTKAIKSTERRMGKITHTLKDRTQSLYNQVLINLDKVMKELLRNTTTL